MSKNEVESILRMFNTPMPGAGPYKLGYYDELTIILIHDRTEEEESFGINDIQDTPELSRSENLSSWLSTYFFMNGDKDCNLLTNYSSKLTEKELISSVEEEKEEEDKINKIVSGNYEIWIIPDFPGFKRILLVARSPVILREETFSVDAFNGTALDNVKNRYKALIELLNGKK